MKPFPELAAKDPVAWWKSLTEAERAERIEEFETDRQFVQHFLTEWDRKFPPSDTDWGA